VEQATRWLIGEVHVSVLLDHYRIPVQICSHAYTTKYRKRCFDQIQGISEDNKELTAEVDQLRKRLETAEKDQVEIESQRLNVVLQLGQKERARAGNLP
jgi:regulator of replication initiation timing